MKSQNRKSKKRMIDADELIERVNKWVTKEDIEAPPNKNWYVSLMMEIEEMVDEN